MSKKASAIASAILIILVIVFFINYNFFIDLIKGLGYEPSAEMQSIRSSLHLTSDGERIFNAVRPTLSSRDEFNVTCQSHDEAVSVLGCYTGDHIYVYNIEDSQLAGVRESTSAHELLHAVWGRLSNSEKEKLIPYLEKTYQDNADILKETIESYDESERTDELYVRAGTQVAKLPEELETHYAKFFADQDLIVSFYDSYIAPFNKLNEEIETLKEDLNKLETEISTRSGNLEARLRVLESNIDEFNNCAKTPGCFASQWAFDSRRSELVAEQAAINIENDEINLLINAYNAKVDAYNNNILRSSELRNSMNSNASKTKIE